MRDVDGMASQPILAIRRGRVLCPATGRDEQSDIYVRDGRIIAIGGQSAPAPEMVVNARGMVVCPGLVDLHVHLREPGAEQKETIETGTRAAVRGGFTTVCAMPNTTPAPDSARTVAAIHARIKRSAWCRVGVIAAATVSNDRENLADFAELRDAGCVAVSDDAFMLRTLEQRREALTRCAQTGLTFIAHAEDEELSAGGVMHRGEISDELGVAGQDPEAESRAIEQWREAWEATPQQARNGLQRPPLHIAHLSTAAGVRALREWENGPTAETAPHYLALTHTAVGEQSANAKMNPPLRTDADRLALCEAVRDGVVSVIATDHAPHTPEEKAAGLEEAPFGIVGLETALSVTLRALVGEMGLPLGEVLSTLTHRPADLLGLPGGRIEVGAPADLLVFDPGAEWTVDPEQFASKGRNTPFAEWTVPGTVRTVMVAGSVVFGRDGFARSRPHQVTTRQV